MLRPGSAITSVAVALLGIAVIMVQSAGLNVGVGNHDAAVFLLSRNALYAALSVVIMLLASRIDIRQLMRVQGWRNPLPWLMGLSLVLVIATMVPHVGVTIGGAHRWLSLGPITFQPSELVKWMMVLCVALWCARREEKMRSFVRGVLPPLALVGFGCVLIVKEDLGTAALVGIVAMTLLLAGGARVWQIGGIAPLGAAAAFAAVAYSPYRLKRIMAFMHPFNDPRGDGYQSIQSLLAIAEGGPTGRGLGNGIQKFGYLPCDTTDFVFGVICEELGLYGAGLVIGLYLALVWFGLLIVRDCRDTFGRLVALGVLLTVGLQAIINIAVVTVVIPNKGIALPLISSGGTGWMMTAFMLGLVAALDRANAMDREWVEGGGLYDAAVAESRVQPTDAIANPA